MKVLIGIRTQKIVDKQEGSSGISSPEMRGAPRAVERVRPSSGADDQLWQALNEESGRVARSLVPLGKAIDTRGFVITESRAY